MVLTVAATNGERLDDPVAERPLIMILRQHRQLREQVGRLCRRLVDCETDGEFSAHLEMRLNKLLVQEMRMRNEMLRFEVESIDDYVAKAAHLCWLLNERDADWSLILQSFIDQSIVDRTPMGTGPFSDTC